ncbi:protein-disulfide reductase DsbD domain-containing protein [Pedobacter cryotolerans]|uniref:Sugar transporter n=1 Tax=Pedobacter cryotolerans TaxID=2571270 RepID=A0A4U1CB35_9SPHI|nr:protein-disulfide reductase DsbD domain-containing protein [Pedobacter cryotolerans]TKC03128.1 sugar transporter [Pedobacter cryotolerans]
MKKHILLLLFISIAYSVKAQLVKPITWSYYVKKTTKTDAILYFKAKLDKGWHMYAQNVKSEPMRLKFNYMPSKEFVIIGKTWQPKPIIKYDKVIKMELAYFEKEVVFTQKLKLIKPNTLITAKVEFMVCNEVSCLPSDEITLKIPVR